MPSPKRPRLAALRSGGGKKWILIGLTVIAVILYAYSAWISRYNLSNIDGVSYMSIARQYAEGLTSYALNAYWSPWVSWLMAPLIAWGLTPVAAFMWVNFLASSLATVLGTFYIWRRTDRRFIPALITFISIFSLFIAQLPTITPDGWVVTWTILFGMLLTWLDDRLRPGSIRDRILGGVLIGATGVLGYLIKQYLIPVFFVTLIIWLIVRMVSDRKEAKQLPLREKLKRWGILPGVALVTIILVAGPWVAALSIKYGQPTIGTSFAVNIGQKFNPDGTSIVGGPLDLPAPPNKHAVAYGEDRGVAAAENGGTFQSNSTLFQRAKYYFDQRVSAFPYYLIKVQSLTVFGFLIVVSFFIALAFGWIHRKHHRDAVTIGILWMVYFAGYAAITSVISGGGNARYYWPLLPLGTMLFSLLLPNFWHSVAGKFGGWRKALAIVLIALVPLTAIAENALGRPFPFSNIRSSSGIGYFTIPPIAPAPYDLSNQIRADGVIPKDARIVGTNYRMTVRVGYYLGDQVYGTSGHDYDISNPAFQSVLSKNGINYFITYTPVGSKSQNAGDYATIVKEYRQDIACSDTKSPAVVPCKIRIWHISG
ncbi:MAG: hypothetical protein JWR36_723 [Glaciihabitans sp.]|nr:hypothetical protein [Glaciihabitans sp.]